MENQVTGGTFQLHLVTYNEAAKVDVTVVNPKFQQTVSVGSNNSTMLSLSSQYMVTGNGISSKVVTVTSDVDISVFGFNTAANSVDASIILPVEDLGTEYFIFTPSSGITKQFAVATGGNRIDWVKVTVSGSLTYNEKSYSTGNTFSFSLAPHEVIQFQSSTDLTGTRVVASAPVAVFSGHKCYNGPITTCDMLFKQLHPTPSWGTSFAIFPMANHTKDIINIAAASADTVVNVDQTKHNLQSGSHMQLTLQKGILVTSSKPIMVSYLFQDRIGQENKYDPFLTNVPPVQLTRKYYRFVTQASYYNYIVVVSKASSSGAFFLDQKPLSHYSFSTKEMNGFRSWEVSLGKVDGAHEIYHESLPFTIYVYGHMSYISYGYSMGQETKYQEPESNPVFNCFPHGAEFHLPLSLVSKAKLNAADVHLEDPACKGIQKGSFVVINVPFNKCGSKVLDEDGKTVYVNTVYGTVPETGIHRIEIPLKCNMEINETLGWRLHPQVTDIVSLGHYNVSLKLYQTEGFTNLVTIFPYKVDLHSRLYVEFQVESDDKDLQIFVETCKASPATENTEKNYNVIHRGCPEDSTLQTHPVSDQRLQRFSLHVFKFQQIEKVYLSCEVVICHNGTSPNRCTRGCLPKRNRRDVHGSDEHLASARLSKGPIVVDSENSSYKVPPSLLVAVIGVMGFVMGLVIQNFFTRDKKTPHSKPGTSDSV